MKHNVGHICWLRVVVPTNKFFKNEQNQRNQADLPCFRFDASKLWQHPTIRCLVPMSFMRADVGVVLLDIHLPLEDTFGPVHHQEGIEENTTDVVDPEEAIVMATSHEIRRRDDHDSNDEQENNTGVDGQGGEELNNCKPCVVLVDVDTFTCEHLLVCIPNCWICTRETFCNPQNVGTVAGRVCETSRAQSVSDRLESRVLVKD